MKTRRRAKHKKKLNKSVWKKNWKFTFMRTFDARKTFFFTFFSSLLLSWLCFSIRHYSPLLALHLPIQLLSRRLGGLWILIFFLVGNEIISSSLSTLFFLSLFSDIIPCWAWDSIVLISDWKLIRGAPKNNSAGREWGRSMTSTRYVLVRSIRIWSERLSEAVRFFCSLFFTWPIGEVN